MSGQGPLIQTRELKYIKEIVELTDTLRAHSKRHPQKTEIHYVLQKKILRKLEQYAKRPLADYEYESIWQEVMDEAANRLKDEAAVSIESASVPINLKNCKETLCVLKIQFEIKKYLEKNRTDLSHRDWKSYVKEAYCKGNSSEFKKMSNDIEHILVETLSFSKGQVKTSMAAAQMFGFALENLDPKLTASQILDKILKWGLSIDEHYRGSGARYSFS